MSSISLVYSNRKVCARGDGQNRRFRLFSNVDPTTRKACKRVLIHYFGGRERLLNPNSLTLTQINVVRGAEPIVVRATSMLHSYSKSMKSFITCDEAICNSWWV